MPRRLEIDRPMQICLKLPESLYGRVKLRLYSELEGRVPFGKLSEFFQDRIREHFDWGTLPLEQFGFDKGSFIRGPNEVLDQLKEKLNEP